MPPRRWVLKCPLHTYALDVLLELFPDACIIQTHRDLAEVVPSTCSLILNWRRVYGDDIDPCCLGAEVTEHLVRYYHQPALRARAAYPGRVFDVSYRALTRDPLGTVRSIYERFDQPLSTEAEQRMQQWLAANPQGKHGQHRYSLEQFGLDRTAIDRLFPDYPGCCTLPTVEARSC